jgi:integrase
MLVSYAPLVEISERNLEKFRQWLLGRGRSDDTAYLYTTNVRSCAEDPAGLTHRLISDKLAPNTVRGNLAALRSWATFAEDGRLLKQLGDLRLPPARRVRDKPPLGAESWKKIVRHLRSCTTRPPAMRHVLLIMAIRGFRSGDVLRLKRTEVVRALSTGKLAYEGKGRKRIEFSAEPIREQLEALAAFRGWERVRDLIGTGTSRRGLSRKVWRAAIRTAKAAGIAEMNPHRYRHTFATNYLAELKGDPNAIVKLQKYMAWESMNTAARYVDSVSMDELDKIGAGLVSNLLRD